MYLIVGGSGTIGREVVRLLRRGQEPLRLLVRDPFTASHLAGPGVELVQGDLARPATLPAALQGVSRVFMVTPSGPTTVPFQAAMVAAAAAQGVERLVRISAHGVGSSTPSQILRWHGEVESLLSIAGIPAVNVRPSALMQNLLASAELIRTTGQFFGTQGDGKVATVDARDVAAAGVGALTREMHVTESVSVTGPDALSYGDQAMALAEVLGRPVTYVDLPPDPMRAALIGAGLPDWLADDLVVLETATRGTTMVPTDGVARLAGHPPRSFREFVSDHRALLA